MGTGCAIPVHAVQSPAVRAAMSAGLIGCMTTPNQHNRIPALATWAADNGKFGAHYVGDDAWLSWLARMVRRSRRRRM